MKVQRGDVVDRRAGMLADLLQREQLRAAQAGAVFAGAADAQRLDDVPQGIERLAHVRRLRRAVRRLTGSTRARATRAGSRRASPPRRRD